MKKDRIDRENYIPEQDELEEETNGLLNIRDETNNGANNQGLMRDVNEKVEHRENFISLQEKGEGFNFPETEIETGQWTSFKADAAQQVGRFRDQVLSGSPASETDHMTVGRSGLKDIIEASEDKLAKKLNNDE
ncbi:hypothetical protein Halha_0445 [Halobacteroides halobius DSM 5150]|uniref:Uncharacterized protein n=1 Tax=Halobacteroides halobius (strain ATCC 35273 / DSM 5150 / MD-1) TaxID=748449 RepID=L0K594_HALHC|nr:hypothetical protein [Halobacteroides halobius]AGB40437.1 hypothetical protein Halha_0445 [Halobacteroides halobius DSM 5150]